MAIGKKEATKLAEEVVREQYPDFLPQGDMVLNGDVKSKAEVKSYAPEGQKSYWRAVYTMPKTLSPGNGERSLKTNKRVIVYIDKETGEKTSYISG